MPDDIFLGIGKEEWSGSAILAVQQQVQNALIAVDGTGLDGYLQGVGLALWSGACTVVAS